MYCGLVTNDLKSENSTTHSVNIMHQVLKRDFLDIFFHTRYESLFYKITSKNGWFLIHCRFTPKKSDLTKAPLTMKNHWFYLHDHCRILHDPPARPELLNGTRRIQWPCPPEIRNKKFNMKVYWKKSTKMYIHIYYFSQ